MSEECPHFPLRREMHVDAWAGIGVRESREEGGTAGVSREWAILEVVKMPGDGSCLFHALAYMRDGVTNVARARIMRRSIVNAMLANPSIVIGGSSIAEWVQRDSGQDITRYASTMAGNAWGGGLEVAVFGVVMHTGVSVYTPSGATGRARRVAVFGNGVGHGGGGCRDLALLYVGGAHYDVVRVGEAGEAVNRRRAVTPQQWRDKAKKGGGLQDWNKEEVESRGGR